MTRPEDKKMGVILIHHARGVVSTDGTGFPRQDKDTTFKSLYQKKL